MRLALVLLCGCFVSPVVPFGAGKSPTEAQHARATELTPPLLATEPRFEGTLRTAKIRVWADDEYRAQNVHWQRTFGEQLAYANSVLEGSFGVHLDAEYREWPRHAPAATLEDSLAVLARQDPGDGVLAVVGLTSSLGLVSATFDKLGVASLPGRHIVLRGYADLEERRAIELELRDLHADERETLLEARRRHKMAAVLLHELGHNLGVPHEPAADTIMNAMYSAHAAAFSDDARVTMLHALEERLGGRVPGAPVDDRAPALTLEVAASGDVVLGGRTLDRSEVDDMLRAAYEHGPETQVVIRAAKGAPHAAVIDVIERGRAIGLHRFAIAAGSDP
ncbi:MAG: biopolymer transporter ExbD [Acidobacteriota bacterium]